MNQRLTPSIHKKSGQNLQHLFKKFSLEGQEISLEQLLEARENRANLQQQCLEQYSETVLSLTLLAVGGIKKNALLDFVFAKALENLTALFDKLGVQPTAQFIRPLETGHEALFVLPIEANLLKQETMQLEDSSPLARLWDIDVIDRHGNLLSRTDFDFPPRPCLVCNDNAKSCARSRKHSFDEIFAEMQRRVQAVDFAEQIAEFAYQALVSEARLSPKPGLVDSINNGSHRDMNLQTFERSALALKPFFARFVLEGVKTAEQPSSQILAQVRPLGLQAEKAMLQATHNVNTHKGAIFAFGLVCTAIGRLYQQNKQTESVALICETVAELAKGLCAELQNITKNQPLTAGVQLFQQYGLTGARGEAESGFELVRQTIDFLANIEVNSLEHQWLIALVYLMRFNPDTNVVYRGGMDGLVFVQQAAENLLKNQAVLLNEKALKTELSQLDQACIAKNLSSGGSADLLALLIFFKHYLNL